MRIVELLNKISIPITNEEAEFLEKFSDNDQIILKSELEPREQVVATQLVNRDVLYRLRENGRIIYKKKIKFS